MPGRGEGGGYQRKMVSLKALIHDQFRRMVDEENRPNFTRSDPSVVNVVAAVRYDRN